MPEAVDVLEALRARFIKTYSAVPGAMREEIIALVDGKPYNWNTAYIEVVGKTSKGDEIAMHLKKLGVFEKEAITEND
ncbi:MAG: hypothetical protein WC607_04255 [Candidatus Micrarchaeia archaeon]